MTDKSVTFYLDTSTLKRPSGFDRFKFVNILSTQQKVVVICNPTVKCQSIFLSDVLCRSVLIIFLILSYKLGGEPPQDSNTYGRARAYWTVYESSFEIKDSVELEVELEFRTF